MAQAAAAAAAIPAKEDLQLPEMAKMVEEGEERGDTNKQKLAYKRSFFVRMVSDPKIYNPKIVVNKIDKEDGFEEEEDDQAGGVRERKNVDEAEGGEGEGKGGGDDEGPRPDIRSGVARRA
jgi:hypothetical protein